jgi:hypothetical protein
VLHLALFSLWPIWWGGVSWGPRFLAPILPVITLLAFWPHAGRSRRARAWIYLGTLARGFAMMVGLVMTLSGVLLHWDAIEGQHGPPPASRFWTMFEYGKWYFRPDTNAVWTNWQDFGRTRNFDLLVLQDTTGSAVMRNLAIAVSLTLLVIIVKLCLSRLYRIVKSHATMPAG